MRVVRLFLLALLGVFVIVGVMAVFNLFPGRRLDEAAIADNNSLRQIVSLVVKTQSLPMKDGVFDPYEFVRQNRLPRNEWPLLRSQRTKTGPTDEEIERGDYTDFPWERYRGGVKLGEPPFPLLWEKEPDDEGMVLVGLSDGTAVYWGSSKLEAALKPR